MTSTWLITGCAGFIGSNLASHLLDRGVRVVGLDNYETGTRENAARVAAKGGGRFRMVEGDIRDAALVGELATGAEVVVHLAAQVSVPRSMDDPRHTNAVNVDGFLNVLLAAGEARARKLVYASSCAVYGDNPALPLGEREAPRPMSPYAATKLINEHYAATLTHRFPHTGAVGLRFFNVYGPWQSATGGYASVIPRWVANCLDGRRPPMFGDGTATRDFVEVGDVCAGILCAAGLPGQAPRPAYNLGTGRPTSLLDLFAAIRDALAAKGRTLPFDGPERQGERAGDILHSVADINAARTELGYDPATDLTRGIARLFAEQYGL
jgi:UDP-N-acetylglucosamine 4-epimerase